VEYRWTIGGKTYRSQCRESSVNRLALQESNADDEQGIVGNGTKGLIESEFDGRVLDAQSLGVRGGSRLSKGGIDLLLDSLTIGGTESLGASGKFGHRGLVDASASLELLCLCPDASLSARAVVAAEAFCRTGAAVSSMLCRVGAAASRAALT
jgi:hypothetical protein